jgi:hypothetical protein
MFMTARNEIAPSENESGSHSLEVEFRIAGERVVGIADVIGIVKSESLSAG